MKKIVFISSIVVSISFASSELSTTLKAYKIEADSISEPVSVDVIEKKKIEVSKPKAINDLSSLVSNTNISGLGRRSDTTITIRGLTNYITAESSVSMYIDDVPISHNYGYGAIDFSMVDSMEVYKGPQGTLFGKNAEIGVINLYTKEPTKDFSGRVKSSFGEYGTREFSINLSGPIKENLTYQFGVSKYKSDGYTKNIALNTHFDERDIVSYNAKVKYEPNSNFNMVLNYYGTKADDGGSPFKINTKLNPFESAEPIKDINKMDNDSISLVAKYRGDKYNFTSISAYTNQDVQKSDYIAIIMNNISINDFFDINVREFSQEFRVDFSTDNTKWLLGAFYSKKFDFDYFNSQNIYGTNMIRYWDLSNPDDNKALFFNSEYWLSDNIELSGGVRFQRVDRSFIRTYQDFNPTKNIYLDKDVSKDFILPKLSLSYYDESDAIYYCSYSQGFRPGGYNYRSTADDQSPFKSEKTNSLEIGYKNKIDNINFSTALFYNFVDDFRVNSLKDDLSAKTYNVTKTKIYGFEADIDYKRDNLFLYASLGLVKGKFDKFDEAKEYEGNEVIDVPDMTASAGMQIDINKNFVFKSSIRYIGERYYDVSNQTSESGYKVVNSSLGYENSGWLAEIYANNLFDERYVDFMIATPTNNYYHFGTPRVVGFKLSKNF